MAQTRVQRDGIEECVRTINGAIEQLTEAAGTIDTTMNNIGEYWEGSAYDNAMNTYGENYETLLKTTIPQSVTEFKDYINKCMETIIEIDNQLAGN